MTLKEIAELAGVGTTTVSRVLNEHPDVSAETREKVQRIIESTHFIPNANARHLKGTSTKLICVIIKGLNNYFFISVLEKIQAEIEKNGYIPYAHFIDEWDDEILAARRLLKERKPLGFIFLGGSISNNGSGLSLIDVPCVYTTTQAAGLKLDHVSSVSVNNRESVKAAVSKIFDHGHTHIFIVGGELRNIDLVHYRFLGVLDCYAERSMLFDDKYYITCKFSLESAYKAMKQALTRCRDATALFAMSDIMAIGAIRAAIDSGLQVPSDLSVVGFDGLDIARFFTPSIATMRQPAAEIAEKSVAILVGCFQGETGNRHLTLDAVFYAGESLKDFAKTRA